MPNLLNHYHSDGLGRDSYISFNNGGQMLSSTALSSLSTHRHLFHNGRLLVERGPGVNLLWKRREKTAVLGRKAVSQAEEWRKSTAEAKEGTTEMSQRFAWPKMHREDSVPRFFRTGRQPNKPMAKGDGKVLETAESVSVDSHFPSLGAISSIPTSTQGLLSSSTTQLLTLPASSSSFSHSARAHRSLPLRHFEVFAPKKRSMSVPFEYAQLYLALPPIERTKRKSSMPMEARF